MKHRDRPKLSEKVGFLDEIYRKQFMRLTCRQGEAYTSGVGDIDIRDGQGK